MSKSITLHGRLFITLNICTVTGLHIGGYESVQAVGDVDKLVVRDPLTRYPYIPGSSLRGKMRSQLEKFLGLPMDWRINRSYIHACEVRPKSNESESAWEQRRQAYQQCPVCQVFGVPATEYTLPTRLLVRDVHLPHEEARRLLSGDTILYTEYKTEVAIDRVTSQASPRTMERVPAGVCFGPGELVFNVYFPQDIDFARYVFQALQLVQDDYLGGQGSRGYGRVAFRDIRLEVRPRHAYHQPVAFDGYPEGQEGFASPDQVLAHWDTVAQWLRNTLQMTA